VAIALDFGRMLLEDSFRSQPAGVEENVRADVGTTLHRPSLEQVGSA
jgi:hypothetical protein